MNEWVSEWINEISEVEAGIYSGRGLKKLVAKTLISWVKYYMYGKNLTKYNF